MTEVLFGGDLSGEDTKKKLTSMVTAVRNVRMHVKNIQHIDGARVKVRKRN